MNNERKSLANNLRQNEATELQQQTAPASALHYVVSAQRRVQEMQGHLLELDTQIAEQRAARQSIEAKLAHYTNLFDLAPVACYLFERDGTIRLSNLRGASLLGQSHTQLQGQYFGAFICEESSAVFSGFLQRVFAVPGKQSCEVTLLPTSQRQEVFVLLEAVADPEGNCCNLAAIDITKRKKVRLAAQKNYGLLSKLSKQIPGILFQYRLAPDGSTHFPFVSDSVQSMYKVTPEQAQLSSSALVSMVHPDDAAGLDAAMKTSASNLTPWRHEFRMMRPDQGVVWRAVEASPEKLPDGSILWHGYTKDIGERKRIEEELRLSEERWKFALDGSGDGVWDWNIQTGEVLYSRRWKEILGYADDEIGNTPDEWVRRIHPEDFERVMVRQQDLIDKQLSRADIELRMLCKDGSWKWILGNCLVVNRDAEGKPTRLVGTNSDISERKLAEETLRLTLAELEERRREAESLSEAKSRFLNAASHDLRQPLYATQLFIDAMGEDNLTAQQQETMKNLRLSIEAMSAQLQMLLEFSRLDMGNIRPKMRKLSIANIFHNLEHTYAPIAREAGVQLHFHPLGGNVQSDLVLITRLVGNLIDNSIKFAPRGHILICARRYAQGVRIEVRDNGPGIPAEHRQHIFEEYYQIDNPARNQQAGLGLGLSIALRISRLLKIPFALQTRLGRGSVFSVTLPTQPHHS